MSDRVADLAPIHFIGIGGAGMSALATILTSRGQRVSGSDIKESPALAALRARGAEVSVGHDAAHLADARTVVVSSAIRDTNPELIAARASGIEVLHRAQLLALLMRERRGIAVAGTHGKTTTSSMIALVLQRAGADPTFLIGGEVNERGTNAGDGTGPWLVAEADESDGSLLWLGPTIAVITNVEAEHLDHYADEDEIRETFAAFAGNVAPDGTVVISAEDPGARAVRSRIGGRVVDFGLTDGAWRATRTPATPGQQLEITHEGAHRASIRLRVPGAHNARNALAAFATCHAAGVEVDAIASGLEAFEGVRRRFERVGLARGVEVIDEYAHHPTEVAAALATARESGNGRIIAVFQPHLYSRTRTFAAGFAAALASADVVVVTEVYGAREDPVPGVSGALIADAMSDHADVRFIPSRADVAGFVAERARAGDLVLTIGAGDVTMLGPRIVRALEASG